MSSPPSDTIRVHTRSNLGKDTFEEVNDLPHAMRIAKKSQTIDNHMVCIEIDGERMHRWDRPHIVGDGKWRRVAPDNFETLGPIGLIYECKKRDLYI